eukprot:gene36515-59642_t
MTRNNSVGFFRGPGRVRRLREARMAETKTKPTDASVDAFLDGVAHAMRRADGKAVRAMMERVTGER